MAIGQATLTFIDTFDLHSNGNWIARSGNVIGTTNSSTVKQVAQYSFTLPTTFNNQKVSKISKLGFKMRGNGLGYGDANDDNGVLNFSVQFLISDSSPMSFSQATATGLGILNYKDLNTGKQPPMTVTVASKGVSSDGTLYRYDVANLNLKAGKQYYIYIYIPVGASGQQRLWKGTHGDISFEFLSYTKCSAPTSIVINRDSAPPSGSTKTNEIFKQQGNKAYFTWSGAKNGVQNNIIKYKLYWRAGQAPTKNTFDGYQEISVVEGSTTGSCSQSINFSTRGGKIYFKIEAIGKATDYNSDLSDVAVTATINSLPGPPIIFYNIEERNRTNETFSIVKSTQTQIEFVVAADNSGTKTERCRPGSDVDGLEVQKIHYYDKDREELKEWDLQKKLILDLNEDINITTFYFYTYDGLEDSASATTITIEKNTKPTIQNIEDISNLFYVTPNGENYTVFPGVRVTPGQDGQQDNNTYKFSLIDTSEENISNNEYVEKAITNFITNTEYYFDDVRKQIIPEYDNVKKFQVKVIRYDGIEESEPFILEKIDNLWTIPSLPKIKNEFNQYVRNLIEDTKNNETGIIYFENKIRLELEKDTGYSWLEYMSAKELIKDDDGKEYVVYELDTSNIEYGEKFDFYLAFKDYNGTILTTHTYSTNLKKIEQIITNYDTINFQTNFDTYNVFTDVNEVYAISFLNIFNSLSNIDLMPYGLSLKSQIVFYLKLINPSLQANFSATLEELMENSEDSTIYFNLTSELLYSDLLLHQMNMRSSNKKYQGQFYLEFKNVFGNDVLFTRNNNIISKGAYSNKFSINYQEKPILGWGDNEEFFQLYTVTKNDDEQEVYQTLKLEENGELIDYYLKENSEIRVKLLIRSYNTNPYFDLIVNRKYQDEQNSQEQFSYSQNKLELITTDDQSKPGEPTPGKPCYYKFDGKVNNGILKEIKKSYTANFKIEINSDSSQAIEENYQQEINQELKDIKINVYKHIPPLASINNSKYVENEDKTDGKIYFNYLLQDTGLDSSVDFNNLEKDIKIYMYFRTPDANYDENNYDEVKFINGWENEENMYADFTMTSASGYIQLKIVTIFYDINRAISSEKTYVTNEIAIYNISPTVAYRKSHLGINTNNFSRRTDGVIYIADAPNREFIIFETINGTRTINIKTGTIDNFILDGGTW